MKSELRQINNSFNILFHTSFIIFDRKFYILEISNKMFYEAC